MEPYTGGELTVRPVYYVADSRSAPAEEVQDLLQKHLEWTRDRYAELLDGETFKIWDGEPTIIRSRFADYQLTGQKKDGGAKIATQEILGKLELTRWNSPYIYIIVFCGTGDFPPGAGGRSINGGFDQGGGIVIMSSELIRKSPNFQSTLQHELGHAFGLPHVDVYGYSMETNISMMSYNPAHHTSWLKPSAHPGEFIPEDLRGLAKNKWAFPNFTYDPAVQAPSDYRLADEVLLGPMEL
jgi:hypothetical protein